MGNPLKLIEVSIEMAEALMFLLRFNESFEVIAKCEKIYNTSSIETPIERNRIESAIALIKGYIKVDNRFELNLELSLKYLKYGLALQKNLGNNMKFHDFINILGLITIVKLIGIWL